MTFGEDEAAGARITSLDEYNKALDHLQGAGYNEVDTARAYIGGKQEAFTRKAHWKERGLTLAVCFDLCAKRQKKYVKSRLPRPKSIQASLALTNQMSSLLSLRQA